MEFPQYRKYKNDLSYFKISNKETFIEWKKQPNYWEKIEFEAKILPDRNYISDMLMDFDKYWDEISQAEFELFLTEV